MSKYSSVLMAIEMMESVRRAMGEGIGSTGKINDIISDLQHIARDVRYGGHWTGNFEKTACSLELCVEAGRNCQMCVYARQFEEGRCIKELKKDAASALRYQDAKIKELEQHLMTMKKERDAAEARLSRKEVKETRQEAQWQMEDENKNQAPDEFPWEGDQE